jgi:ATP-independent RNA helicase DbpA
MEEPNAVTELFYEVDRHDKIEALISTLAYHKPENALIFCTTKVQSQEISDNLSALGVEGTCIHGGLEQYQRTDVLVRFANRSSSILIATDVAARGLDICDLAMVINYDLPQDRETYVHRIGRTARAGKAGIAVSFYPPHRRTAAEGLSATAARFAQLPVVENLNDFTLQAPNMTIVIEGGKKDKLRPGG